MDRHDMTEQIREEQELLRHHMEGMRLSTTWQVQGPDASRKLSTLRFVTGSFQRHLERLLALEEDDGFRSEARRVVQRLEPLPATDPAALEEVGRELVALLDRIERHNRKEMALLLEAFERDEGGEG